jgi:hypothetical protein
MSFDLHITLPDNSPEARLVQAIVSREHVSPEEAVRKVLRGSALEPRKVKPSTSTSKPKPSEPLTMRELEQFEELFPSLGLLGDVTDEQWLSIEQDIGRMKRDGFRRHA